VVYHRILFVGNSLTIAQPLPDRGWTGKWGMAASQPDKDYVHRVQLLLAAQQGVVPEIVTVSADLHRWASASVDVAAAAQKLQPDLVIVQMGEHTTSTTPYADFQTAYAQIAGWTPDALHIATGIWGGPVGDIRGENVKRAAGETGMVYVQIRDLHTVENEARQYTDKEVAWHPNDRGMERIALRILAALGSNVCLPLVGN
jgi:hypothetical protein